MEKEYVKGSFEERVYWFVNGWRTVRIPPEIHLNQTIKLNELASKSEESKKFIKFLTYLQDLRVSVPTEPDLGLAVDDLITSFEFDLSVRGFKKGRQEIGQSEFVFKQLMSNSEVHPDWEIINEYIFKWCGERKLFDGSTVDWKEPLGKQSLEPFIRCIQNYINIPSFPGSTLWYNKFANEYFTVDDKPVTNFNNNNKRRIASAYSSFKTQLWNMNQKLILGLTSKEFGKLFP